MASSFSVADNDRYKDTVAFESTRGPEFAIYESPEELDVPNPNYIKHVVVSGEVGMLDSIAVLYYGSNTENLWWFIAKANNMLDPESEMFVGQVILIPPRSILLEFTSRVGRG